MSSRLHPPTIITAIVFTLACLLMPIGLWAQDFSYHLDNGMEVILKENHSSPMVASVIFVRSGSKYESRFENGITHFLEHLLFDGTVNQTRLELDKSISHLGGYINAFTRKDGTVYLVLLPRQYIDYGLTVQADMLMNSVFPDEELTKERKVVIEEIKRDADSPNAAAEAFHSAMSLAGTDYSRPVIGYEPFIANISKDAIVEYWKRYYRPGNMTALIIGDFETEDMKQQVAEIFGSIADSLGATEHPGASPREPLDPPTVSIFDTVANVTTTSVSVSVDAPAITDSGYYAFDLLAQYLALDDVSPLTRALTTGDSRLATSIGVSLSPYEGFSRLDISIETDKTDQCEEIIATTMSILAGMSREVASPETIEGIKTSVKTADIYYAEKLHYYAFIIAPQMLVGGWDFVQSYAERLDAVSWADCQSAAERWLNNPSYIVSTVRHPADSSAVLYEPESMTTQEVTAYFDTAAFAEYDLTAGHPLTFPATDSVSLELVDEAVYYREVLANGLTVIVKSSPDSRVFAMNLLGKNRTLNEPAGMAGITDFVNHMIEKGTRTRDAAELSRGLARIGANVTLYDNPWIPYDDRYTTRRFSFMKYETIEQYAPKGFFLFADMILNPALDSSEVENVRRSLMGSLGRGATSPRDVARQAFFDALFEGSEQLQSYSRPVAGEPRTIGSISRDDLREHHRRFYDPSNMIIAIGTSRPVDEIMDWVENAFGRLAAIDDPYVPASISLSQSTETRIVHTELESEQTTIYIGAPLPGANSEDAIAIQIATSVLSNRLYRNLREIQGLAYSVGAGTEFDRDFGYFYSVIGTGWENYQTAVDGIILEIDKLKLDGPTFEELNGARNSIWGQASSARLSRINQAYYLAVDEYLGRDLGYDQIFLEKLQAVTPDDIRRVASRYFPTSGYILTSAGKK